MLKKQAQILLEDFLEKGPFSSEYSAKEALDIIASYREQLRQARAIEESLRRDLGLFNISLPDSLDLAKLERVSKRFDLKISKKPKISFRSWTHWNWYGD